MQACTPSSPRPGHSTRQPAAHAHLRPLQYGLLRAVGWEEDDLALETQPSTTLGKSAPLVRLSANAVAPEPLAIELAEAGGVAAGAAEAPQGESVSGGGGGGGGGGGVGSIVSSEQTIGQTSVQVLTKKVSTLEGNKYTNRHGVVFYDE